MCIPELFYLCPYVEVGRAGVRLELPLCLGHVFGDWLNGVFIVLGIIQSITVFVAA